ncbi:hypothetical protein AHAS_Ahas03G0261600 [Arachis hypogaea]
MPFPKPHSSSSLLNTDKTIKHVFDSSDRKVLATYVNKVWHKVKEGGDFVSRLKFVGVIKTIRIFAVVVLSDSHFSYFLG